MAISAAEFAASPGLRTFLWLTVDGVSELVPIIPGTSVRHGSKILIKLRSRPSQAAKALPRGQIWTAGNFAKNLAKLTGKKPLGCQAHHVFPQKFEHIFKNAGFDIHDPRFGTWWPKKDHLQNAYRYNKDWEVYLQANRTPDEILIFGRQIMKKYGFGVNF